MIYTFKNGIKIFSGQTPLFWLVQIIIGERLYLSSFRLEQRDIFLQLLLAVTLDSLNSKTQINTNTTKPTQTHSFAEREPKPWQWCTLCLCKIRHFLIVDVSLCRIFYCLQKEHFNDNSKQR
jgi:hypothetical protein